MSKKQNYKYPVTQRSGQPTVSRDPEGNAILWCPFCEPKHPLTPDRATVCGTTLEVSAKQVVYRAKYDKRLVCAKCRQGGGEMVQWQNGFVHSHECSPGIIIYKTEPTYSKLATFLAKWKFKNTIFGEIVKVEEVMPDGQRTGKILGHFFERGTHGRNKPTLPTK